MWREEIWKLEMAVDSDLSKQCISLGTGLEEAIRVLNNITFRT